MIPREERLNSVNPGWEPIPWDANEHTAEAMCEGYADRAGKAIHWNEVPFSNFPEEGLFGHDRDWFISHDITFFATGDGEDLLLIENTWFGWPDPPRWGLASRPHGRSDASWQMWGCFPDPPAPWIFTQEKPNAAN